MSWLNKPIDRALERPGCTADELFDGIMIARGGASVQAMFPRARVDAFWRSSAGALQAVFEIAFFDDETHQLAVGALQNVAVTWKNGTEWTEQFEQQLREAAREAVEIATKGEAP